MLAVAQDDELDRGPAAAGSERTCALTRTARPSDEMIRFVAGPDGVVPDVKRKLPGRGIWITAARQSVEDAVKRNIFARGFKKQVAVPPDLAALTERLLETSALDALAIAGKAGNVLTGFAKVEAALAAGDVVTLLHAADASEDGLRKIAAASRRNNGGNPAEIPHIRAFSSAQLDLALNRLNVVHAALLAGPVSDTFLARATRFERFRNGFWGDTAQREAPDDGAKSLGSD